MASILLIDDEAPLLRLMQVYLTKIGHAVDGCGTAAEARRMFADKGSGYDLVVVDRILPDGDGIELLIELAERNSQIAVLLCSGYPYAVSALPDSVRTRAGVLQKPFLPTMLAQTVEQLVNKTPGAADQSS